MTFEHDFQNEVIDRLARIEERLVSSITDGADQEERLRQVEKRQWFLAGVAAVAGSLLGKVGLHIPSTW